MLDSAVAACSEVGPQVAGQIAPQPVLLLCISIMRPGPACPHRSSPMLRALRWVPRLQDKLPNNPGTLVTVMFQYRASRARLCTVVAATAACSEPSLCSAGLSPSTSWTAGGRTWIALWALMTLWTWLASTSSSAEACGETERTWVMGVRSCKDSSELWCLMYCKNTVMLHSTSVNVKCEACGEL